MDFKIELVPLAVSDVDRSVEFYGNGLGWSVDHDRTVSPELRFVQVTPPGSACSICFGIGLEMMPQGSSQFIQIVVSDADAALAHLRERGIECDGVDEQPWGRFVRFDDPDGNRWALQQIVIPSFS
jgi:predicted enzyme related to lactoylglutathione lyase